MSSLVSRSELASSDAAAFLAGFTHPLGDVAEDLNVQILPAWALDFPQPVPSLGPGAYK